MIGKNITLTGGEAQSSRWFENEQDLLTEIENSIEEGDFEVTTIFATKRSPEYPATIAMVLVDGRNVPDELMPVDNLKQVKEVVYACYGADAVHVPMSKFNQEINARSFHTSELIALLQALDYDHVGLSSYIVYGAPMRPTSSSWARIDGAVYMDANKAKTGFHSYVIVPSELDKSVIENYELMFVSRPFAE